MGRYVTISVVREVKERLEQLKRADENWSSFLSRLINEYEELKRRFAFEKLVETLSPEDLESIENSVQEFRERFRLGEM